MTRPILKWVGGKRRLADQIIATFPKKLPYYLEPFCGGAAVFLRLRELGRRFEHVGMSDRLEPLITTYREIKYRPRLVASELQILETVSYVVARDCFNFGRSTQHNSGRLSGSIERAALFLYLNRRGFNGLHRVNQHGKFNVPEGCSASGLPAALPTLDELLAFSDKIKDVQFKCGDFHDLVHPHEEGLRQAIVYADPPYVPASLSSFTAYAGAFDHRACAQWAHWLAEKGVCVRVSNSDTAETRALYKGFTVIELASSSSVSGKAEGRGKVRELLLCAN
jgi:DNA adenine methylase